MSSPLSSVPSAPSCERQENGRHFMRNRIAFYRQMGIWVGCLAVPPLLGFFVGPALGVLAAVGAGAFWFVQYGQPAWKSTSGSPFWYLVGGYGVIGLTLLVCLGRILGVRII